MTTTTTQTPQAITWTASWTIRVIAVGVAAGFLSGIFGVGGGILMVPCMVLLLGLDQRKAHGTSLTAIIPIAIAGTLGYAFEDKIDWTVAFFLTAGAAGVGAFIGTYLLNKLPQRTLAFCFAGLMALTAVRMFLQDGASTGRASTTIVMAAIMFLVGVIAGTLAGLLGVGGGIIVVPIMIVLFGIPAAIAKGTSLAMVIPTSLVGTYRNLKQNNTIIPLAAIMGSAGVISSYLATKISVSLDEQLSNRLFAGLLIIVMISMVMKNRKAPA